MIVFRLFCNTKIVAITVITLLLLAPTALASPLDAKREELRNIDAQIRATKSQKEDAARRQAEIRRQLKESDQKLVLMQFQLNQLQTELNEIIADKHATEAKLEETQKRLNEMQAKLEDTHKRLALRREAYDKRLVGTYKNRDQGTLNILLNSKNIGDFMTRIAFLQMIAENDSRLVLDMKQLAADISDEITQTQAIKEAIDEQRKRLIAEKERMNAKMQSVIAQQELLEAEAAKQQQLYAQVEQEKRQLAQTESELRASSDRVAGQLRALSGGTVKAASTSTDSTNIRSLAAETAKKYGIPQDLFFALIKQESGWNYRAVSRAGAIGLTQVMPFNVVAMGYDMETFKNSPAQQLEAGARYLSQQYKTFGSWKLALAAYNAGPGAVLRYNGIPPYKETRNYVRSILAMAN